MRIFKIMMLGIGNGFAGSTYHNNALVAYMNDYYLIDCGTTAWQSLHEIGITYDDISGIIITHLHFDHCGGLAEAAFYGAYASQNKLKLWVPEPLKNLIWQNTLKGMLESCCNNKTSLKDFFDVEYLNERQTFIIGDDKEGIEVCWVRTEHIPSRFSCSYILDGRLFYSGDMTADTALMEKLYNNGVRCFFHDVNFKGSPVHASLNEIKEYPPHVRENTFLMHYSAKPDCIDGNTVCGMQLLCPYEWIEIDRRNNNDKR